eukprot:5541047-Pyramimonas_sp.AAC.1
MSRATGWVDRFALVEKLKRVYGRDPSIMMLFKDLAHGRWRTTPSTPYDSIQNDGNMTGMKQSWAASSHTSRGRGKNA